ncbi:beta-hexosaminidase [Lachnospiraceae bacterium]|nr:beta-hexosaminidase [Lachnospiraceae bacterium]
MRNQIFAYLTLIVLIVLVLTGGYFGVSYIIDYVNKYNDKVNKVIEEAESSAALESVDESDDIEVSNNNVQYEEGYTPLIEGDQLKQLVESLLNEMTTEEMVAGMFIVSPESITGVETVIQAEEGTRTAITENPVGGIIYAPKNFKSPEQFTQMLTNTKGFSKYPLFTAVRAECGTKDFGLEATAKASELTDVNDVVQAYGSVAAKLVSYGINMDFAPVADIVSGESETTLQDRIFGSDVSVVAPLVNASVQSVQSAKVSAVLLKFPSILEQSKSLEELKNSEFIVYDAAIKSGVDCIMVSHVKASSITGDDTLSSFSSVLIQDILRNTLGFDGVVMTDSLSDSVVTGQYSSAEAAVAAIQAGADLLLEPAEYQEAYEGVLQAVTDGTIPKERIYESIYRIYRVKYKNALE